MLHQKRMIFIVLPLIVILAACSSLKLPGSNAGSVSGANTTAQPSAANQPLEQKLATGTLKLEGTSNAVTADQAKTLLPLWRAVKSLSSSSNTTQDEINAVYQQIEAAMTAQQIQAIKAMSLGPQDTQALMKQYNIQAPQMPQGASNGTPAASSGKTSSGTTGNSGSAASGAQAGGGPMGGDFNGMPPDAGGFPGGGAPNAQTTRVPRGTPGARPVGGGFGGGMNNVFVSPLINVLAERAGVPIQATATATPAP